MTTEDLIALAEKHLRMGIETMRGSGELMQQFFIYHADGSAAFFVIDGAISNSESAKAALAAKIREHIRARSGIAVIMLSDVFWATVTDPEADKIIRALGLNIEQSAAMGLCEKREAVIVTLQSPILKRQWRQEYRRNDREITLVGDVAIMEAGKWSGRFMTFFPENEHAA